MSQTVRTFDASVSHIEARDGETIDIDPNHPFLRGLRRRLAPIGFFGWSSTAVYRVELKEKTNLKGFCASFDHVFAAVFGLRKIPFSFRGDRVASFQRVTMLQGQTFGVQSVEIAMSTPAAFTVTVRPKYRTATCMLLGILALLTIYTVITFFVFAYFGYRCFTTKVRQNEPLLIDQFDAGIQDMARVELRDIRFGALRRFFGDRNARALRIAET